MHWKHDLRAQRPGAHALGESWSSSLRLGLGFIFVPPYVPHQEINASADEEFKCVLMRGDNEAVVVNLDIEAVEKPSRELGRSDPQTSR